MTDRERRKEAAIEWLGEDASWRDKDTFIAAAESEAAHLNAEWEERTRNLVSALRGCVVAIGGALHAQGMCRDLLVEAALPDLSLALQGGLDALSEIRASQSEGKQD